MSTNPIWIAGYGTPTGAGASPVWIAGYGQAVAGAAEAWIAGRGGLPAPGATLVQVMGYGGPVAGASPIWIGGYVPSASGGAALPSVWSAADAAANGITLSNGGLTASLATMSDATSHATIRTTKSNSSGKYYAEYSTDAAYAATYTGIGLGSVGANPINYLGEDLYGFSLWGNSATNFSAGFTNPYTPPYAPAANKTYALAVDFNSGKVWLAIDNVWVNSSDPVAATLPVITFVPATVGPLFFGLSAYPSGPGLLTLHATLASLKYAPPSGFSAWDGGSGGSAHSAQAVAYLARTVGGNEGGNGENVATLIDGLVADGVWAKLNCLYLLAQQNATDAKLNLIGASNTLPTNTATFTVYKGYSLFPTLGIDTGFNASTLNPNSFSIGAWCYASPEDAKSQIGTSDSGVYLVSNDGGAPTITAMGLVAISYGSTVAGLYSADITSSTTAPIYINGVNPGGDGFGATSALESQTVLIGAARPSGYNTAGTISAAYIGNASMGATLQLALYNRLRTYMTAVGVP